MFYIIYTWSSIVRLLKCCWLSLDTLQWIWIKHKANTYISYFHYTLIVLLSNLCRNIMNQCCLCFCTWRILFLLSIQGYFNFKLVYLALLLRIYIQFFLLIRKDMPKQSKRDRVYIVESSSTPVSSAEWARSDSNWPSLPAQNDNQQVIGHIGTHRWNSIIDYCSA